MTETELYDEYKGVYVPKHLHPPESLKYYEDFTFRPDDVLIVTFPKSGTTWLQEMIPLVLSEGDLASVQTLPNWDRVPWLEEHRAIVLNLEERPSPRVFATHFHHYMMNESYLKVKPKVVYVMRNPKDVFTSSFHYYGMASYLVDPGTTDEFLEKFLNGKIMFGSWFDHVKGWLNVKDQENIFYIAYEEMIQSLSLFVGSPQCGKMTEEELYCVHKGVYVPKYTHPPESLQYYEDFTFRPDDVLIVTYPKSGTIWLQEMIPLILSNEDLYTVQTVPNWDRAPWLEVRRAVKLNLEERPSPRAFSTHYHRYMMNESYLKVKPRVVYAMRNPKDVFTSCFHYYGTVSFIVNPGPADEFLEKFLNGKVMFGSWFDHVKGWLNVKDQDNIFYIAYEEMIQDLKGSVSRISQFLGKSLSPEVVEKITVNCEFKNMKQNKMSNYSLVPEEFMDRKKSEFLRKVSLLAFLSPQCGKMTEEELYYVHKGVYVPKYVHPPESLQYYEDFTFRPDDVLIVTYPKSGTIWLQEMIPLILSDGDLATVQTVPNWDRVPWLEGHLAIKRNLEERPSPRAFATHYHHYMMNESYLKVKPRGLAIRCGAVPKPGSDAAAQDALDGSSVEDGEDGRWEMCLPQPSQEVETLLGFLGYGAGVEGPGEILCQVVYAMRNPKDVFTSCFHFYETFSFIVNPGPADEFLEKFLNSKVIFGSWFDHVKGWLNVKDQDNIFYIAYEEMKKDLKGSVSRISQFLGKSLSPEVVEKIADNCEFKNMKQHKMSNFSQVPEEFMDRKKSEFLRKGVVEDWKNLLTEAQAERFDALYKDKMKDVKFKFAWD
ncbi:hypothetical protein NFI96_021395 [Prochilodus magdalenae]|nr:hypothetical protein NFI96_021395 [Prochilodus magdalenae]